MLYFCGVYTLLEMKSFDSRIAKSAVSETFDSRDVTSTVREELDLRINNKYCSVFEGFDSNVITNVTCERVYQRQDNFIWILTGSEGLCWEVA